MGCGSCGTHTADGKPSGCRSNGNCSSGGCNRMNVYDWLSDLPFSAQNDDFKVVEVSFKNGSRKGFFRNLTHIDCHTGDLIVVECTGGGYDIGRISLSGELVRLQLKKRHVREDAELSRIIRVANERDVEQWEQLKAKEYETMLIARVIARDLNLDMKIGDVEFQGDGRKATFYYTAADRVDFRELIKVFAREFRVRVEMRQIGARQEAGRIGGIGTCGRELCCSTWLTDFKSVSTVTARYQNLAINQAKLSGQCGRLKCCLNYELDTYLDALMDFPRNADTLQMQKGWAKLIKTDIFKRQMWYIFPGTPPVSLTVEQVKEIQENNRMGNFLPDLSGISHSNKLAARSEVQFETGVGEIQLEDLDPNIGKKKRKRKRKPQPDNRSTATPPTNDAPKASPKPRYDNRPPRKDTP